jgi:hypothetical protein
MSRSKRLKDWPEKLDKMSESELRRELNHWHTKARILGLKGCDKMAYEVEKVLNRRFPESNVE